MQQQITLTCAGQTGVEFIRAIALRFLGRALFQIIPMVSNRGLPYAHPPQQGVNGLPVPNAMREYSMGKTREMLSTACPPRHGKKMAAWLACAALSCAAGAAHATCSYYQGGRAPEP